MAINDAVAAKWQTYTQELATQMTSKIRGTVLEIPVENAGTYQVPITSKGTARTGLSRGDTLIYSNPSPTVATITANYIYSAYLWSEFDLARMSWDAKAEYSKIVLQEMLTQYDAYVIAALAATPSLNVVTLTSNAGLLNNNNLSVMAQALNAGDVETEDRTFLARASAIQNLVADSQIGNNFGIREQVTADGYINRAQGFTMINRNMLPLITGSPNKKRNFAYHKNVVTVAMFQDIKIQVERVEDKDAWQILGTMYMGAAVTDPARVAACDINGN